jgi:SAM-dependent methyltransferase
MQLQSPLPPHAQISLEAAAQAHDRLQHRISREVAALSKLPKGAQVVSIGEGTGEYMLALARLFPSLAFTGFDLDPARVEVAEQLRHSLGLENVRFEVGDGCRLPLADRSADYVYARSVLHVVPDKQRFLAEVARIARGPVSFTEMRNIRLAWIVYRVLAVANAVLGRRPYQASMAVHWPTEAWLREIGAYHGPRWYLHRVRPYFPGARLTLKVRSFAIDCGQ